MKPIRVLNVVGRMDRGGIETMIMNLYRNIDREKVQFDFLAHYGKENADYNEEIRRLGGRIYEMPVIKTTERAYYSKVFEYRKALIDFFKEHREYRVLHGHMTNTASIYMPIAKKYGKVSCCIAHSHLSRARQGLAGVVTDILQIPIRKYATDYFACSEEAGKWLFKQKDFDNGKVKIIKNAIDSESFAYNVEKRKMKRSELGLGNELVIGHVGRFFYEKNHDFLIDIFREVLRFNHNAVLILVGEGTLMAQIKSKVERLGIQEKVKFLGLRNDISELMQAMDIFVLPSHFEGLPVVGIEAQASGLPCVMSDVVTAEVNIGGLVSFMSLDMCAEKWAKCIIELSLSYRRENTKKLIIDSGYDIKAISRMMQDFYLRNHENLVNGEIR